MRRIYRFLLNSVKTEYEVVKQIKATERSNVNVLRHKKTGTLFVFRHFIGSPDIYRRISEIYCPHLPRIYEVAEQNGEVAVLEEYIAGDTLSFILKGVLSSSEAKNIISQLCKALWVLHGMGAVHRDIKPENVMMRGADVILIDFDASRFYKSEQPADTQVLGTTGYAAPEQYGISQTDHRADIYSLGVLLNVMLTGNHPSKELAGGRLGRIVEKCTMMNPKKRYRNVLHLMEML